jgi:hypothetical protein
MGKTSKVAKRIQGGQSRDTRSAAVPTCAAAHARGVLANAENEKSPSMTGFLFMSSGLAGFDRGANRSRPLGFMPACRFRNILGQIILRIQRGHVVVRQLAPFFRAA